MESLERNTDHWKVVHEVVAQLKEDPSVLAINVFGSLAAGKERSDSDIDIEIISDREPEWRMDKEMRHGLEVDYVYTPIGFLNEKVEKYPFLSYVHLKEKVIYDPSGIMHAVQEKLREYYDNHPEIREYWDNRYETMREHKAAGTEDPVRGVEAYDEAERLFSDSHNVTRTFWRE
ncbi:MAG TPA: nucleotidyltransferase domain-containing protein [Candidatus Paceibacterota bacterium]|nr:nucleotidyltransferase domain-containing protein [Candidatus Paceibacterota bacterium]